MKILNTFPPNYDLIQIALDPEPHAIFCYGDTIYNPSGREITPDVEFHEEIHMRQQGNDINGWYTQYLQDPQFRLEQELEAYGEQYKYAKERIDAMDELATEQGKKLQVGKNKLLTWGLESMALALAGVSYGNLISFGEAKSKIRNYALHQ